MVPVSNSLSACPLKPAIVRVVGSTAGSAINALEVLALSVLPIDVTDTNTEPAAVPNCGMETVRLV
ncbi:hypothetical protein D3C73_831400 [compost metagenome]